MVPLLYAHLLQKSPLIGYIKNEKIFHYLKRKKMKKFYSFLVLVALVSVTGQVRATRIVPASPCDALRMIVRDAEASARRGDIRELFALYKEDSKFHPLLEKSKFFKQAPPLHRAVLLGDSATVSELLASKKVDVNGESQYSSPLHYAVLEDFTDIARLLLEAGADAKGVDKRDLTPLHGVRSVGMAKLLLKAGASVNAVSNRGRTPLHHAAASNNVNLVKYLLGAGANAKGVDEHGRTPLHGVNFVGIAKLLLGAGANVNAKDNLLGHTPLHDKAQKNKVNMVRYLLDAGADINAVSQSGKRPFDLAVWYHATAAAEVLKAKEIAIVKKRIEAFQQKFLKRFGIKRKKK